MCKCSLTGMDSFRFYGVRRALERVLHAQKENDDDSAFDDNTEECPDYGSDYMPDDEELERAPLIDEPDDPPESRPRPSQQNQGHKMASSKIKRSEHPLWRQIEGQNTSLDTPEWLGEIEPSTTK
ncbi:uncharacterized protein LOC119568923 isoform X2 [Penaeus monodon]|uniref:uncharacterized protein LOC119568923 isoform X2 n=1 Tax=Penaeus monodon TaxID=6687 RepID=UPI0018A70D59|nr:uncharacterized protein LOC119568923 isoform X2 [Penaeus monodon]